jgi:hypothetical protein
VPRTGTFCNRSSMIVLICMISESLVVAERSGDSSVSNMLRLGLCCLVVAFSTLVAGLEDPDVDYDRKAAPPKDYVPPSGHEVSTKECGPWPKEVRAGPRLCRKWQSHPHHLLVIVSLSAVWWPSHRAGVSPRYPFHRHSV